MLMPAVTQGCRRRSTSTNKYTHTRSMCRLLPLPALDGSHSTEQHCRPDWPCWGGQSAHLYPFCHRCQHELHFDQGIKVAHAGVVPALPELGRLPVHARQVCMCMRECGHVFVCVRVHVFVCMCLNVWA